MMKKNYPVLYKQNASVITEVELDKFSVKFLVSPRTETKKAVWGEQKVREKDVILLWEGEISSQENYEKKSALVYEAPKNGKASTKNESKDSSSEEKNPAILKIENGIKEAWELLSSDEETLKNPISFSELCSIAAPDAVSDDSFFIYKSILDSIYFSQDEKALKQNQIFFTVRTEEEIESVKQKLYEKEHEEEIHNAFIARLKERKLLPEDAKFMVEVENLALGRTEKSRVMQEAGVSQTMEKAHQLLLDTGIWNITKNPWPTRYGLSMNSATEGLGTPPEEERIEVPGVSWAIDSPWSNDPDDAVAFDGKYLWVHIADPASSVLPDSSIDKVARNKGTTLYLPEGAVRMLSETCFEDYALGLKEKSNALSFRLLLTPECTIEECKIFKTTVNVKRLTYEKATELKDTPELKPLFDIAAKNIERRKRSGATNIDLPEIHISVDSETKKVSISPLVRYEADAMVCEMMLLAGEGAAHFAMNNRIPFPYVSQDAPEMPKDVLPGLAGQFKLLRGMRKRNVSLTPGMHSGLGIAVYTQVTSPLRRYSDLICHQQLRAFIDGKKLISKDDMLLRVSQGDAASVASRKASRYSETHWKLIYLLQNPEWEGKAVCIEKKDSDALMMIPSLAMQITLKGRSDLELNQEVTVRAKKIDIVTQTSEFEVVG